MTLKCPQCGSTNIENDITCGLTTLKYFCNDCEFGDVPERTIKYFIEGTVYFELMKNKSYENDFNEKMNEFLELNNLKLNISIDEEQSKQLIKIREAFEEWATNQNASDYKNIWNAFDKYVEEKKYSQWYFDKIPDREINIVKHTCKELGMTYKQLGELIGYSEPAIKKAAQTNTISEPMQKAIELYKEVLTLKLKLLNTNKLKKALKELLE